MAKITLDPELRRKLEALEQDAQEREKQFEALEKLGALPPSFRQAHDYTEALRKALLEHF